MSDSPMTLDAMVETACKAFHGSYKWMAMGEHDRTRARAAMKPSVVAVFREHVGKMIAEAHHSGLICILAAHDFPDEELVAQKYAADKLKQLGIEP